jgi:hypothetical protein
MPRRSRQLATACLAGLCFTLAACSAGGSQEVTARTTPAGVVATNHATRAATWMVVDLNTLASANLVDCSRTEAGCPRLEPGKTITIPWQQITGDLAHAATYEMWWSLVGTPARSGKIELPWPTSAP